MARADQLNKILRTLTTNTPDVEACAIVSSDGLSIASVLPQGTDDDAYAAMSAALLGPLGFVVEAGELFGDELRRGELETVMIRGKDGYIFLTRCGADAVLTVLTTNKAKLGLIFLDVQRSAKELATLL